MGKIQKLSPYVANLIAAGEVVERPASVVKELLENSIDAGATAVTVEIKNGGIDLISVSDNGCGMSREDAEACFMRHATSKIASEDDLRAILTLGFRGEALAAISAVVRVDLVTRTASDDTGTHIVVEAGNVILREEIGAPVGTTVKVYEIFRNVPARMKFLKKNATEANAIAAIADSIALSHPEIAVRFVKDGRQSMITAGDGKLLSAIYSVRGREFAASLTEIPGGGAPRGDSVTVWGYVTKPEQGMATRGSQYFILNGRNIRSRTMMAALEEAYRGSIMTGKYPGCVLQAAINPEYVDVNVHPSKLEVKFANERAVFEAVYTAVKSALTNSARPAFTPRNRGETVDMATPAQETADTPATPPNFYNIPRNRPAEPLLNQNAAIYGTFKNRSPAFKTIAPEGMARTDTAEQVSIDISAADLEKPEEIVPLAAESPAEKPPEEFRIVGELFRSYIVVELRDEVMYIDKHAAHERIIYNELLRADAPPAAQMLLEQVILPVARDELSILIENRDEIYRQGLEFDEFGGGNIIIHAVPEHIGADQAAELIADFCERVNGADSVKESILHSIACKAAVKAGMRTDPTELRVLVAKALALPDVRFCPHGRPVAVVTTRREFEKGFKRV